MNFNRNMLSRYCTHDGVALTELCDNKKIMLVFLRHFGCIFCREALEEISRITDQLKENEDLVLIHMADAEASEKYFKRYRLENFHKVSDPDCKLYQEFGLTKGTFNQLFGFHSWIRGIEAGLIKAHGFGVQLGDGFQMPGVFVIENGKITAQFKHKLASDKPNYLALLNYSTC
ncbi:MAG TPA: peroxiredoxin-like family protein [Saprospiraceae bacterium]|nr:peroxiredoxin-like family protein [Saprospiraceae bacterium]